MMRNVIMLVIVTAISYPAMATATKPINYSDSFESSATYVSDWAAVSGLTKYPRLYTTGHTGNYGLMQYDRTNYGIENDLADGDEMPVGGYLEATSTSPLVVGLWWNPLSPERQKNSFILEITGGGNYLGIANQRVNPEGNNSCYFSFNGAFWIRCYLNFIGSAWNNPFMTINSNGSVTVDVAGYTKTFYGVHNGSGFDTLRIRSLGSSTAPSWIDDVYVTGGNIVPEPAALALMGLGLPWILPRRRR
ncbi:MAG: PEP-CTERM sorting domain-containing protein [Planctomycetota bacterium]|nr:MAG: PEP-CTERM sorting domain-containing protein [Planctomycetota bacterium]